MVAFHLFFRPDLWLDFLLYNLYHLDMDITNRNETPSSLEYHTLVGNFGFVEGKWHYIHKRKPLFAIEITIVEDPNDEVRYRTWLDKHCRPLSESF